MNIALWIVSGLLAAGFLASGSFKLFLSPEEAAKNFEHFGYAAGFAIFIALCEMAGAIGLLIPRLAGLAASGLAAIMLGAVYSHATNDPISQAIPALVMGLLCGFVIYGRGLPFLGGSGAGSTPSAPDAAG